MAQVGTFPDAYVSFGVIIALQRGQNPIGDDSADKVEFNAIITGS